MNVFGRQWFKHYQKELLRWANMPIIGLYFRWVCAFIKDVPFDSDVTEIRPDGVTVRSDGDLYTMVCYDGPKTAYFLHKRLFWLWEAMHYWDFVFQQIQWDVSFGFDTLSVNNPTTAGYGGTFSSNPKSFGNYDDWTNLSKGNYAIVYDDGATNATIQAARVSAGLVSSSHWTTIQRGLYVFNLASLPTICNVNTSILGLALSTAITHNLKNSDGTDMSVQMGLGTAVTPITADSMIWSTLFTGGPPAVDLTVTITNVDPSYNYFDTADTITAGKYNGKLIWDTTNGGAYTNITTQTTIAGGTRWNVARALNSFPTLWGIGDVVKITLVTTWPPSADYGSIAFSGWATSGSYSSLPFNLAGITDTKNHAGLKFGVATRLDQSQPTWQSNTSTIYTVYSATGNLGATPPKLTITYKLPSQIVVTSGDAQAGYGGQTLPLPLTVTVEDSDNVAVPSAVVTFAIGTSPAGATAGSVSSTTTTADPNGLASTNFTLGYGRGTYTVTCAPFGFTASTVSFSATENYAPSGHWTYGQMEDMARLRLDGKGVKI